MQPNSTRPQADDNFGLVGNSPALQELLDKIRRLGASDSPVIITGESGVGKELVARALYRASRLNDRVYLPVDAASLVGTLMESELFGYQKGAFTGATETKQGLVRAADGGTLFLDEIGELPLDVQAKLLRLLQEGEIRPIGAVRPVKVNVRFLAATNRDMAVEVKEGRFRKDLYYRLNVITLHIPPLRERPEDIRPLVNLFVERHGASDVVVPADVMELLESYHWPGNVRELENTVRGLLALKTDPAVCREDLPSPVLDGAQEQSSWPEAMPPLAEIERRHILHVMERTKGDVTAAANVLGVGRTTLYRRLKDYRASSEYDDWTANSAGEAQHSKAE